MDKSIKDNGNVKKMMMATQLIKWREPAASQCPLEDTRWRIICEWPSDPRLTPLRHGRGDEAWRIETEGVEN